METARCPMPDLHLCLSHSFLSFPSFPRAVLVVRKRACVEELAAASLARITLSTNKKRSPASCNSGKNPQESERSVKSNSRTSSPLSPKIISAQLAIALFALGFVDAGYSGDWSRIRVITKETEDLLKIAATVVVPLCTFLVISLLKSGRSEDV